MRRAALCVVAVGLFGGGVWLVGEGAWIHVKAKLAQALIGNAWQAARHESIAVRPWPWADMSPVALLEAPSHRIRQVVLSGASGRTLAFGPAHLDASAAIGSDGVIALAGHRDTHFAFLEAVRSGDALVLTDTRGRRQTYRVTTTEVADARSDRLRLHPGGRRLVLVTCYPFDAVDPGGPLRFVVTAVAEDETARPPRLSARAVPMPLPRGDDGRP